MTGDTNLGIANLTDVELIGSGGFSVVYAATHTLFDRRVAVKVLTSVTSDSDRRKFEQECRAMGRLSGNPNVVTVFHADYTNQGKPYLIMELVKGGTLHDHLDAHGPIPWQQAIDLVLPVSSALAHAHEEQILHRDIKPENILIDDGVPKLTDFGIARLRDATGKTSTHISASWLHTPPETFNDERDERSDIYSLASTLYTLIVGQAPFWRDGDESVYPLMQRLLNEPAPQLPIALGPPQLSSFLVRAMAKDPTDRPQTASELAASLAEIRGVAPPGEQSSGYAPAFQPTEQVGGLLARTTGRSSPAVPVVADYAADGATTQLAPAVIDGSFQTAPDRSDAGGAGGTPPPRRSRFSLVALLALALVGLAAVAFWAVTDRGDDAVASPSGDDTEIVPEEAPVVPSVVGQTELDAIEQLGARGIDATITDRVVSDTVDEGRVIVQDPEPGAEATLVALTISTGPELAEDGGGTGNDPGDSTEDGGGTGNDPGDSTEDEPGDGGGQDQETDPVVPSVIGLLEAQAISQLKELDITASPIDRASSETVIAGLVISQNPAAGAEADSVQLTISTGPPEPVLPLVPDVEEMLEAAAIDLLQAGSISVVIAGRVPSDAVAVGFVISQTPKGGSRADEVALTISLGRAASQDCLPYNASDVTAVDEDVSGWLITDGVSRMLIVDNETDAQAALALVRRHTNHCFIGRGNQRSDRSSYIFEYWTGSSGISTSIPNQDCISFNQDTLEIIDEGASGWLLSDGRSRMNVLDNEADAVAALVVARQHARQCFIGRDNTRSNRKSYIVDYWE